MLKFNFDKNKFFFIKYLLKYANFKTIFKSIPFFKVSIANYRNLLE